MFQELKNQILKEYSKHYPFFQGDWKNFSSKDIRQLIDLIETTQNERVSEKWIYTHLKPDVNEKLPRKDMLDIFSKFTGYLDWDEFVFKNQFESSNVSQTSYLKKSRKTQKTALIIVVLIFIISGISFYFFEKSKSLKTVEIKNQYTKAPIKADDFTVYSVTNGKKNPVEIKDSKIQLQEKDEKLLIESPYFEKQEIDVDQIDNQIFVKPEDYALVLKTYMQSNTTEWQARKDNLEKILSDELEVIVLFKDDLGAEYLNKKEFSQKLIIPTSETKKMEIVTLETNNQKQIIFIRIKQL
ncbi:hypothetical protein [Flavobacterium sp. LC2016-01]|uniref:hypothetical protein n=1 Tax=Flavobacterium sp. LC2016-01 TaxID=2675876 RepID=UPI0012BAB1CE|nr:hypothetical protein [Flavobacterium sp. LC2016-01]MTH16868.1 hypothetical protein [Flavobacterium sp. LC2016-01]